MDRLMKELEEDSNNLTEEAKERVNSQVVEVAMSSARRGDMRLLNYIKQQELDRVNIGLVFLGSSLLLKSVLNLRKLRLLRARLLKDPRNTEKL